MLKQAVLPSTFLILLSMTSCLPDWAVVQPWNNAYVASSKETYWTPPTPIKQKESVPLATEIPENEIPLSLAEALDIALKNNTQTQLTWAQARTAAAQFAQSQSQLFPTISSDFYYERSYEPDVSINIPEIGPLQEFFLSQWGPQFTLSYTIFDFGQIRATSEAARQALYYADWTHNRAIQTLVNTITDDYYNYLYQKQLLEANREDLETAQVTLDSTKLGRITGVKDLSDYLQARTQVLQNEIQLVTQRQAVETSYTQLLSDMGLPANLILDIDSMPEINPDDKMLQNADELLTIALEQRADLLAAKANLESKKESLSAARRKFAPNLTYNFEIGRTYFSGGTHDNYDFYGTLSLNFPLFSGFYDLNGVKLARAAKEQAEAQLKQMEIQVIQDVTNAHTNVKTAFETLKFTDAFLKAAEEQYKVAIGQYRAGTTSILTVVSAQSTLADARAKQVGAVKGWFTALADLTYATGIVSENFIKNPPSTANIQNRREQIEGSP